MCFNKREIKCVVMKTSDAGVVGLLKKKQPTKLTKSRHVTGDSTPPSSPPSNSNRHYTEAEEKENCRRADKIKKQHSAKKNNTFTDKTAQRLVQMNE